MDLGRPSCLKADCRSALPLTCGAISQSPIRSLEGLFFLSERLTQVFLDCVRGESDVHGFLRQPTRSHRPTFPELGIAPRPIQGREAREFLLPILGMVDD